MTNADKILPAWDVHLDGKPGQGRVIASNEAEALRCAIQLNPALKRRLSVKREVAA